MPRSSYEYEVRGPAGRAERGRMEAESAQAVSRSLQAKGYYVVSVRPAASESIRAPMDALLRRLLEPVFYPVSSKARASFFLSLRALLSAGMNISEGMLALAERTGSPILRRAAREMAEAAVHGRPMSSVMERYPAAFNQATMAAIEAGEQSGLIEQTAGRLATYFDRSFQLEQTYRWQTFYPKVLVLAALLIPTVPVLFMQGLQPWLNLMLLRALPVLGVIVILWYGWRLFMRLPLAAIGVDRLKLLMPWFGSLARRMATARWARALSMLAAAGVPIHRALVAAAAATGNKAMQSALTREAEGVLHGRTVTEVLAASHEIPGMAMDMLGTAERSGSIEGALDKVAEYYESETEVGGKQTAVAVGVLAYLAIAAIIAFMVISAWGSYFQGLSSLMSSME